MKRFSKFIPILIIVMISILLVGCGAGASSEKYSDVAGKYYLQDKSDVIEFKADGKFDLTQEGQNLKGTYENENGTINIKVEGGMEASGEIKGSTFTDNDGLKWIKK